MDIAIGESGLESEEPITVGQMFQETVKKAPDAPALKYKNKMEEEWKTVTYSEYYQLCIRAAKSFLKVGVCCVCVCVCACAWREGGMDWNVLTESGELWRRIQGLMT